MKETESKQSKTSNWHRDSVLTADQFKQLIEAKVERARRYTRVLQQETRVHDRR